MKILLEGPDCVGKTTLAKTLSIVYPDSIYIHNSNIINEKEYKVYTGNLFKEIKSSNKDYIIDRLLPSEYIYGNIYRGKSRATKEEAIASLSLFDKVIFCLPANKQKYLEHFNNIAATREEYITDNNIIGEIYTEYIKFKEDSENYFYKNKFISPEIIQFDLTKFLENDKH